MPEVEVSRKVLACDEVEVTAAESVVADTMVWPKAGTASARASKERIEISFFMVLTPGT
jgi:hypothetical protein